MAKLHCLFVCNRFDSFRPALWRYVRVSLNGDYYICIFMAFEEVIIMQTGLSSCVFANFKPYRS